MYVCCCCFQHYPPGDDDYIRTFLAVIGAVAESQVSLIKWNDLANFLSPAFSFMVLVKVD